MNSENIEINEELEGREFQGRKCSEVYSCIEDIYYFINLALPFAN